MFQSTQTLIMKAVSAANTRNLLPKRSLQGSIMRTWIWFIVSEWRKYTNYFLVGLSSWSTLSDGCVFGWWVTYYRNGDIFVRYILQPPRFPCNFIDNLAYASFSGLLLRCAMKGPRVNQVSNSALRCLQQNPRTYRRIADVDPQYGPMTSRWNEVYGGIGIPTMTNREWTNATMETWVAPGMPRCIDLSFCNETLFNRFGASMMPLTYVFMGGNSLL